MSKFSNAMEDNPMTYERSPSAPPPYDMAVATASAPPGPDLYPPRFPGPAYPGYGEPQPVLQQPQPLPQSHAVNVTTSNVIGGGVMHLPVGPRPIEAVCPTCGKRIRSRIHIQNRLRKWCCCCCLFLTGICTLCSCLPFFVCAPTRFIHSCPSCHAHLGTYVNP